jgi:hypothetical protein
MRYPSTDGQDTGDPLREPVKEENITDDIYDIGDLL